MNQVKDPERVRAEWGDAGRAAIQWVIAWIGVAAGILGVVWAAMR